MRKNKMANNDSRKSGNGASLGFEAELFKAADKLRGNMEPSDYKHVVLGLIFLKYISDTFERATPSYWPKTRRPPRTGTNTSPTTYSGYPRKPAGRTSRPTPSAPRSAPSSTMPCAPSKRTTNP